MASIRKTTWFIALAIGLVCWIGMLVSLRGVAEAGVIASHGTGSNLRAEDIAKMEEFLERKMVLQRLMDYGVSPEEAMTKIRTMSGQDLHRLASMTDRMAEGADSGVGVLVGLAVLVILILIILMLMDKKVVIRGGTGFSDSRVR
jgi:hypothetical protein